MYLYVLKNEITLENEEVMKDVILLQHEKNYTETEFKEFAHEHNWRGSSLRDIAESLQNQDGFRIVPEFVL